MSTTNYGIMEVLKYEWPGGALTPRTVAQERLLPMQGNDTPTNNSIPDGYCKCGCGERTKVYTRSSPSRGNIKGQPASYVSGHQGFALPNTIKVDGDTAYIELSRDIVSQIDTADVEAVRPIRWSPKPKPNTTYVSSNSRRFRGMLHRFLLGITDPSIAVDHINGDGLDNRRSNLRIASPTDNTANSRLMSSNTSGFKGVSFFKSLQKWETSISIDGKKMRVGIYDTPVEAAMAYDNAARDTYGVFAALNFPRSGERSAHTGEIKND